MKCNVTSRSSYNVLQIAFAIFLLSTVDKAAEVIHTYLFMITSKRLDVHIQNFSLVCVTLFQHT
jgi:hypothetical protein